MIEVMLWYQCGFSTCRVQTHGSPVVMVHGLFLVLGTYWSRTCFYEWFTVLFGQ